MSGIVAIVGRPNVGKSTLFNRFIMERKAIVDNVSGVTRDRHYGDCVWNGNTFTVIDTGGYVSGSDDIFESAIREQVHIAMEEADVLLFMVDSFEGVTPLDTEFARIIRRSKKPAFLVANKADNKERRDMSFEFYELNLGQVYAISAMNGHGTGELLDDVVEALPKDQTEVTEENIPKFAIVGRPNAGKSSFVNAILGKEHNIVTPISGTTRDSIYTRFKAFDMDLYLVDTAGLRRKAKVHENIEFYSTLRAIRAIEECDVAILLLDAELGIQAQDLHILSTITTNGKGVVILVNKWDLLEKETNTARDFEARIKERIAPMDDVPIVFGSVLEKQRILKALELAVQVYKEKNKMIPTSELNEVMQEIWARHRPAAQRGKFIRIKYVTQIAAKIPTFLFFVNHPKLIQDNYKRYLENQIREHFGFTGVPMNLFFRDK